MKKSFFVWIGVMLLMVVGMSSCSSDDETADKNDGTYIITGQPAAIGITYAILGGEFYPDHIPSAYKSTPNNAISLGIEIALTNEFIDDEIYTAYARGIEGNHMEVSIHGLRPNTDYYYRAFVDVGTMKLYGEKKMFKTSSIQIAYTVEDATDITFTGASFKVNFQKSALPTSSEDTQDISYGLAYSENRDAFSKIRTLKDDLGQVGLLLHPLDPSGNDAMVVVKGLSPAQTYYYCTYAAVAGQESCQFGDIKSFTTMAIDPSQLVTLDATDVGFFSATLKAVTTLPSLFASLYPEAKDISYGISYAPEAVYPGNSYKANEIFPNLPTEETFSDGTITAKLSGLYAGTKYIFRPYVRFGSLEIVGDVKSFTTSTVQGELMVDAVDARFISADVTGHTLLPKSVSGISYVFNYVATDMSYPTQQDVAMTVDGERLSAVARGLSPGHNYECWISANLNGHPLTTSEKKTFRAQDPGDYIFLDDAIDITSTSAVINCKLSPYAFEGNHAEFAYIYYGKDKNDLTQMTTANADGDHLSVKLTNLLPNTTYYYRASALCILSFGLGDWFYSEMKSFTTKP